MSEETRDRIGVIDKINNIKVVLHLKGAENGKIPFGIYSYEKELVLSEFELYPVPMLGFKFHREHLEEYSTKGKDLFFIGGYKGIFYSNSKLILAYEDRHKNTPLDDLQLVAIENIIIQPNTLICVVNSNVKLFTAEIPDPSTGIYIEEK